MKGGKVIGSGNFGCIFDPALICKGETTRKEGFVTKLLTKSEFDNEMKEVDSIKPIIERIPNNEKYFVLTQNTPCITDQITESDLIDYNDKCKALTQNKITKGMLDNEIKQRRLMGIQMKNAGIDLKKYIEQNGSDHRKMVLLLRSIKELISNGIFPMNNLGVNHNDVKGENMGFDGKDVRLIDWGFASNPRQKLGIFEESNLPLMFNQPMTNIIFYYDDRGEIIPRRFNRFLQNDGNPKIKISKYLTRLKPEHDKLMEMVKYVKLYFTGPIFASVSSFGREFGGNYIHGHAGYISEKYFNDDPKDLLDYISGIISYVLVTFSYDQSTNNFKPFNSQEFYDKVFRHNVDIYGVATILNSISLKNNSNAELVKVINTVQDYIMLSGTYITKPYDISDILKNIDKIISALLPAPSSTSTTRTVPSSKRVTNLGGKSKKKRKRKSKKTTRRRR